MLHCYFSYISATFVSNLLPWFCADKYYNNLSYYCVIIVIGII